MGGPTLFNHVRVSPLIVVFIEVLSEWSSMASRRGVITRASSC